MRQKRMLMPISLLTVGGSVSLTSQALPKQNKPQTSNKEISSQSTQNSAVTENDRQILEVVLRRAVGSHKEIIVSPTMSALPKDYENQWKEEAKPVYRSKLWYAWKRRNSKAVSLKNAKFAYKGIRIEESYDLLRNLEKTGLTQREALRKAYPKASGQCWVTLPGYSHDGRRAVIEISLLCPASGDYMSETSQLYLLTKGKNQWKITKIYHAFAAD